MGCGGDTKIKWTQFDVVNKAYHDLLGAGLTENMPAVKELYRLRGELLAKVRGPFPRITTLLKLIPGASPGHLRVWFDVEQGWMVEGREKPGADPAYRSCSAKVAAKLLSPSPPADLVHEFTKPVEYVGE